MNLKELDQTSKMLTYFPDFYSLSPEQRSEIREVWANLHKYWAQKKMHDWGFDCDSDNCGKCRNNK